MGELVDLLYDLRGKHVVAWVVYIVEDLLIHVLAYEQIFVSSLSTLPRRVVSVTVCLGMILLMLKRTKRIWVELAC
jgi:hypothetical protein